VSENDHIKYSVNESEVEDSLCMHDVTHCTC
jgi:hypothetical protein